MSRYVFIAMIVSGILALAVAGWLVKGARTLAGRGAGPRPRFRPAVA